MSANPWGGKLHTVSSRSTTAMCFECGGPLLVGEYVHSHFGGLVIIHCRCACREEIMYADTEGNR